MRSIIINSTRNRSRPSKNRLTECSITFRFSSAPLPRCLVSRRRNTAFWRFRPSSSSRPISRPSLIRHISSPRRSRTPLHPTFVSKPPRSVLLATFRHFSRRLRRLISSALPTYRPTERLYRFRPIYPSIARKYRLDRSVRPIFPTTRVYFLVRTFPRLDRTCFPS